MDFRRTSPEQNYDRFLARGKRARKWASLTMFVMTGAALTAIWQEKRLAPPVHDGMQVTAVKVLELIESSEGARSFVTAAVSKISDNSDRSGSPVTAALLKLRQ
ncbi:hypothetical protein ROA7450_02551 [Roseovarius albus]|uniref:Uncharacterized protein n=1 Tax=Roseovarius albus TaxID=1247867 RepID=A0A1X6ZGK2_9RHOB|nr:hypothetical protein [Roseovarius albus]SLN51083.1 hypothetical protein ROA7450_02551 [Roseovarius albus]